MKNDLLNYIHHGSTRQLIFQNKSWVSGWLRQTTRRKQDARQQWNMNKSPLTITYYSSIWIRIIIYNGVMQCGWYIWRHPYLPRSTQFHGHKQCVCVCCVFSYSQIKMYKPRIFLPTSLSLHSKCKIGCWSHDYMKVYVEYSVAK